VIWQILYHDGFRFSDEDGTVDDIPIDRCMGALGIWLPGGRSLYNKDNYIWREDYALRHPTGWIEVDDTGLKDHLILAPRQVVKLIKGLTVPWGDYRTVLDLMREMKPNGR
jgi:hypothetical protein